jgi:hypothetical protein
MPYSSFVAVRLLTAVSASGAAKLAGVPLWQADAKTSVRFELREPLADQLSRLATRSRLVVDSGQILLWKLAKA